MSRLLLITILGCASAGTLVAQQIQFDGPLTFGAQETAGDISVSAELIPVDAATVDVAVTVKLPEHHYIYSTNPKLGSSTKISFTTNAGDQLELSGTFKPDRDPKRVNDQYLGPVEKFYDKVTWTQRLTAKSGSVPVDLEISGELTGMYCSAGSGGLCTPIRPPRKFTASMPAQSVPEASPQPSQADAAASHSVTVVPKMRLSSDLKEPPIRFTVSLKPAVAHPGDHVMLSIRADIDEPYHVYSITQDPEAAAIPTEISITGEQGAAPVWESFRASAEPESVEKLGQTIETHHGSIEWTREYVVSGGDLAIEGSILFQVCTDRNCLAPAEAPFRIGTSVESVATAIQAASNEAASTESAPGKSSESLAELAPFILLAVGYGFFSLLTPCVFPMIPVTISYFLKQGESNPGSTLKLACIYCLSIVGAFTGLGLLVTVLFGHEALNQLASNGWLNLFFAAVFTAFGLMLLGMFEFRMPSWLVTWTSKKQSTGGIIGVVFMAFTFTLVSFTCTAAFVGTVLIAAANGSYLRPIIGMAAFSAAFASPFFLLALFPSMLKKLPKSGGWMNRVKVTLGLVELAVVPKFLSVADIYFATSGTPQYLDYHLVMGLWIAASVVTGLYLLGLFSMPHDTKSETVGPLSCVVAMGFMGLAAYIAVGLFSSEEPQGKLWNQIVAFAPPTTEVSQEGESYFTTHDGLRYELDFDAAVEEASAQNKPLFVDFTGVNCQNCRLMEKGVLKDEQVHDVLSDLVRVQLYADKIPGVSANEEEHARLLKRIHDLQENWVQDASLPVYVIATPDGQDILATFKGLASSDAEFEQFLEAGLDRWNRVNADRQQSQTSAAVPAPTTVSTN